MFHVPVTYYFDFLTVSDKMRPYIMQEFAGCGAKHLVLSEELMSSCLRDAGKCDTFLQEMQNNGLSFCDAHAPFGLLYDMHCPFPEKRRMLWARHKLLLEICAYMKVKTITIHVGGTREPPSDTISLETHNERIRETLAEILPYAEKLGIIICIENGWYPTASPANLLKFKKEFPTDALGFCYDSGHANIMDNGRLHTEGRAYLAWKTAGFNCTPPWENDALEKMLPHVVNCHLHDNMGDGDSHTLPGRGNINWNHIIPLLKTAPRLQVIQSEVIPAGGKIRITDLVAKMNEFSEL